MKLSESGEHKMEAAIEGLWTVQNAAQATSERRWQAQKEKSKKKASKGTLRDGSKKCFLRNVTRNRAAIEVKNF